MNGGVYILPGAGGVPKEFWLQGWANPRGIDLSTLRTKPVFNLWVYTTRDAAVRDSVNHPPSFRGRVIMKEAARV